MLDQKSVLIVEDEMLIAVGIEQVAVEMGARTTKVMRVSEALAAMDQCGQAPDICVIDYRAADPSRRRLMDFLGSVSSKVIAMTTDSFFDNNEFFQVADAILKKPFGDDEVRRAFIDSLRHHRSSEDGPA